MNMDIDFMMNDHIKRCRDEMTSVGYQELKSSDEVDGVLQGEGTSLVMVNSVCGCAGGIARPAAQYIVNYDKKPDHFVTVFAGQDKEATEQARSYFADYPPSSPSFAFIKDGEVVEMIERHQIEGFEPIQVAQQLQNMLDENC